LTGFEIVKACGRTPKYEDLMNPAETAQQPAVDFLGDPATHGGAAVERIVTHAARVFLAGPRVLKIKRAVRFPFLDYSTLEKRKAACEAEIEVNRPFAPTIYRGVVPITREAGGGLAISGGGEPMEWAVDMARFDETQTLDRIADAGKIDDGLADALGRVVAQAHAAATPVKDAGFLDKLAEIIAQNGAELSARSDLFDMALTDAITQGSRAALNRLHAMLTARERDGLVRRCHGDLHLGNIVLIDGKPVLFDAIEFDPNFATGDLFYDLAFLLMDLIERGLRPTANIVLNRYLAQTRRDADLDALAALPLLMSVRAAIRAKVTAARSAQDGEVEKNARDYCALAARLLKPPKPKLVAVGGLSGTGKSLLARALAADLLPEPGAVLLRSDTERKAIFGVNETEPVPKASYTPEAAAQVYTALGAKARRVLAAGQSAIVDAVFANATERADIAKAAAGHAFQGLFLDADLATRLSRIGTRKSDASDADAAVARAQEHYDLGAMDWHKVDASGGPADTLRRTKAALGS
jgi:aminoglycoside phosphotransferase family enzyme/predicted kinase